MFLYVSKRVIGPRKTFPSQLPAPHNVPFILLGAGLLWFGWFRFNAGSALASGGLATVAFVATNTAAAAALTADSRKSFTWQTNCCRRSYRCSCRLGRYYSSSRICYSSSSNLNW